MFVGHRGREVRPHRCSAPAIAKVHETIGRLRAHGVAVILTSPAGGRIHDRRSGGGHDHIVGARRVAEIVAGEILHMIVAGIDARRAMPPQASA
jgi:hypothetical protein